MRKFLLSAALPALALCLSLAACSGKAPAPLPPAAEPTKPITLEGARTAEAGPPAAGDEKPADAAAPGK